MGSSGASAAPQKLAHTPPAQSHSHQSPALSTLPRSAKGTPWEMRADVSPQQPTSAADGGRGHQLGRGSGQGTKQNQQG